MTGLFNEPSNILADELPQRLDSLRRVMRERDLTALLLTAPEDIYYLTGLAHQEYFAFSMLVVPSAGPSVLVTREMERTTVADLAPSVVHVPYADDERPSDASARALRTAIDGADAAKGRVGVDRAGMNFPLAVWEELVEACAYAEFCDGSGLVEDLRQVKSGAEIGCVRQAAEVSSRAMEAGIAAVASGVTERDIAAAVSTTLITEGSEPPGFVPLIRAQDRLFQEHCTWTDRTIVEGDRVFIELSGSVARYHAPLTRMVYVGAPHPQLADSAALVTAGLETVRAALVPGAQAGDVYAAWQKVMDEGLGHDRYRRHHCGYMTGIGFPPSWSGGGVPVGLRHDSELEIKAGMVFHVISWLLGQQLPDYVLSDTMIVTGDGGEILTPPVATRSSRCNPSPMQPVTMSAVSM
ncbi:Xaa-Pro peptidase family protein [Actinopolymorpha sp. B11F2]|uniref:M24 family metallopeptidase n=1 Tax=Actinopolymorpha sp. B11F2 TaxID=3160862 RepID=UPI0032E48C20